MYLILSFLSPCVSPCIGIDISLCFVQWCRYLLQFRMSSPKKFFFDSIHHTHTNTYCIGCVTLVFEFVCVCVGVDVGVCIWKLEIIITKDRRSGFSSFLSLSLLSRPIIYWINSKIIRFIEYSPFFLSCAPSHCLSPSVCLLCICVCVQAILWPCSFSWCPHTALSLCRS